LGFAEFWRTWWDRLAGHAPPAAAAPDAHLKSRPPQSAASSAAGEDLQLEREGKTEEHRRRGAGRAGFDPYSNDAGYDKPRNWDEVDTR
jgi:hypothetical protein